MGTKHRFEIPELFPQPKQVELGEGISELAVDVRLATSNVWPVQRKALRSILTMGGVRVVANKKKYVVDARVIEDDPEAFNLSDVPEACRRDYYELRVQGSEVFVRSPYQEGMVWAAQTLACLFRLMINGIAVPNLFLRDWPDLPLRGAVMDCNWWTVHMGSADWYRLIDSMSQFKLNLLGVSVYDCQPGSLCRSGRANEEYLLLPLSSPAAPSDPRTVVNSRYYNAKFDRWYCHDTPPALFENDAFGDVVAYGNERGVTVYPCFNLANTAKILPKAVNGVSARNSKGKAGGAGFCVSSPEAREALVELLGGLVGKYYPAGVEFFQLGVGGLLRDSADSCRCQCAGCAGLREPGALAGFIGSVAAGLLAKGVKKVVLAAGELGGNAKQIKETVGALLRNDALKNHLVVMWQGSADNGKMHFPAVSRIAGTDAWISATGCAVAQAGDGCMAADGIVTSAIKHKADAAIVRMQFDPAWLAMFAVFGVRCWETQDAEEDTPEGLLGRWAQVSWEGAAPELLEVRKHLLSIAGKPVCRCCFSGACVSADGEGGMAGFPLSALEGLAGDSKAVPELEEVIRLAEKADEMLTPWMDNRRWNDLQRMSLQSLKAAFAILRINALFYCGLLRLRQNMGTAEAAASAVGDLRNLLTAAMLVVEGNLPDWLVPGTMQQLGCHKLFLEQLQDDLKHEREVRWTLDAGWQPPEDK